MPRIIVTTESSTAPQKTDVLLDELVHSVHMSTDHAAAQLVERLAWAVSDAEVAEGARVQQMRPRWLPERRSRPTTRTSRVAAGV